MRENSTCASTSHLSRRSSKTSDGLMVVSAAVWKAVGVGLNMLGLVGRSDDRCASCAGACLFWIEGGVRYHFHDAIMAKPWKQT